ncbi:MAG TPA: ATPase, T2SS/T4P/T4SS family [Allosphingosinicella sp.]|nr:ATPase, T2SS/T4P/T4SS family [Allosphingosinicella sp.]
MSEGVDAIFRDALAAPSGIVLAAGPPRSGRATTLQAALTLRPDAFIAGEVRDRETAEMAVQAALDGALVLAVVNAGDAVAAITRLKGMKVESFLIASTLRVVLAQRLVQRLCPDCRRLVQAPAGVTARLGFDVGAVVYEAPGCAGCDHQGHRGRIGLFEAISIDMDMRRLINGGDEAVIASHAFRDRPNLAGAARAAVCGGAISAEEALRLS